MSAHEEGIIREAAAAAKMAQLHGCVIEVKVGRLWRRMEVRIVPDQAAAMEDPDRTLQLPRVE